MKEVANPFSVHRQKVWMERAKDRAADPSMDLWIRVGALAFGCHKRNGHANFKPNEIAEILGPVGSPLSAQSVSRAIMLAKKAGWIAPESTVRCLVVPPHAVTFGLGKANARCVVHKN
jgi:hypothetical protein